MAQRLIDLSMAAHEGMMTFPRVQSPKITMLESWMEFADNIGAGAYGENHLTAHYVVSHSGHAGAYVDTGKYMRGPDVPGPEGILLEYCYSEGVVLDFRHMTKGASITVEDVKAALSKSNYTLNPRDIVLTQTGALAYNHELRYLTDHDGMTGDATHWLIAQGVRMMDTDAPTFAPLVWAMFERKDFWLAYKVMIHDDYWHLENLPNIDKLPTHGFTLSVFPIAWQGTTRAPLQSVGIVND